MAARPGKAASAAAAAPARPTEHAEFAEFARAFPFHLVITPAMAIGGIGPGLARFDPALPVGDPIDAHFALREPTGQFDWALLRNMPQAHFCLVHRQTGLEIQGRMVLTEENGPAIFLGRSWLDDAEQLADFGVNLDQLSPPSSTSSALSASPAGALAPADFPAPDPAAPTRDSTLAARCASLERCLRLHQTVHYCLAEINEPDAALALLTQALPTNLGWAAGCLWQPDAAGNLAPVQSCPPDADAAGASAHLASKAFSSGAPAWSSEGCGGVGGFAIPVHGEVAILAVLTCISRRAEPADAEFAAQLYLSAGQLARYLARHHQKERLARLSSELSAIFQLSSDGFVAFNNQGVLSYLNPAFAHLTGVDRDELRGLSEAEFEARLASLQAPDSPAAPAGDEAQLIELRQPRRTILQRSRREARDIEGRLVGRLLYFRDLTRETELLRANGEFLANAAHELRTPMASIHGFTELLLKRDFAPERQREVLQTIHRQSSRLSEIVNELLDVARFDAHAARDLQRTRQALGPLVEATVAELLVRGDPRPVTLTLAPNAATRVEVDRDRFIQALTNVLSNAYKYSPAGGPIELSLPTRSRGGQRWIGVAVRDHGIGMTAEELGHLFERFFRAHPAGSIPGTGLGMAMIKKIIDAHGGTVEVDSAPGRGTEVTLWLPVAEPDATA